jgi:hypothetical protein
VIGPFEAEAARQRRGCRGGRRVEGGNGEERGGPGAAWDSAAAQQRPAAARSRHAGAAQRGHVARPAEQGRGGGTDWWAMATVPGSGTG